MAWIAHQILTTIGASACECLSEPDLVERTGLKPRQIEAALLTLRRRQLVSVTAKGCHRLTATGRSVLESGRPVTSGPRGPQASGRRLFRRTTARDLAWNALRITIKTTLDELLLLAAQPGQRDPRGNLRKYLWTLARAGVVRQLPLRRKAEGEMCNGAVRYLLVEDLGPLAPRPCPARNALYDPNGDRDLPLADPANVPRAARRRPGASHDA